MSPMVPYVTAFISLMLWYAPLSDEALAAGTPDITQAAHEQFEHHMTEIHDHLAVTSAQEAEFFKLKQVMLSNLEEGLSKAMQISQRAHHLNAVDRMKQEIEGMQLLVEQARRQLKAFTQFYGALTLRQKLEADEMFN